MGVLLTETDTGEALPAVSVVVAAHNEEEAGGIPGADMGHLARRPRVAPPELTPSPKRGNI